VSNAAKAVLTILSLPGQVHCRVGLRGSARNATTKVVEAAACRFCECWGRDADEDKLQDGRKRNTNTKHWTNVFRSDNVRKHMVEQHSKRWKEYQALRNNRDSTEEDLKLFFQQSTVDAFLEKRSTVTGCKRVFTIETSIVDGIVKELLNPPNSNDEADPSEMPRGDPGVEVFEPAYVIESDGSKTISCYRVTINNALQFDCVVSLLAAGLIPSDISSSTRKSRAPWLRIEHWVRFRCRDLIIFSNCMRSWSSDSIGFNVKDLGVRSCQRRVHRCLRTLSP
jgi:hypothetical protein